MYEKKCAFEIKNFFVHPSPKRVKKKKKKKKLLSTLLDEKVAMSM
jgi:hypothetical protein